MVFRGIYPAPELKPTEFGLFSAARVVTHTTRDYDERWVRGFSQEFDSQPTVRLLDSTGGDAHTLFDGSRLQRFQDVESFFIEVEDFRSAFNAAGEDRFARVLRQLEVATQKAVERELWDGYAAQADGTSTVYLTKAGEATLVADTPATGLSPAYALAALESALSNSPVGEQGVLHLTRDIATLLGSQWLLMRVEDDPGKFHVETINGTTAIVGSGYTGDGPMVAITTKALATGVATITTSTNHYLVTGEQVRVSGLGAPFDGTFEVTGTPTGTTLTYAISAPDVSSTADSGLAQMVATTTEKWVYATGAVDVHLGKPELVNDNLGQGFDVSGSQNDMRIKANRPAAVYFDPSMHYAVKVDLSV